MARSVTVAVYVVLAITAVGCKETDKLAPALYSSALVTCDCSAGAANPAQFITATFTASLANVGSTVFIRDQAGKCVMHTFTPADDGKTFDECYQGGRSSNNLVASDADKIQSLAGSCREPSLLPKCIAVTQDHTQAITPVGAISFDEKCRELCQMPMLDGEFKYCDASIQQSSGGACTTLTRLQTHVQCAGLQPAAVAFDSCAPISDKDPVALVAHVDATKSRATINALDGNGAVTDSSTASVSGFLAVDADRCASSSCPFTLLRISFRVGDFTLGGEQFQQVALGEDTGLIGTLDSSGTILVPAQSVPISIRGELASDGVVREGSVMLGGPVRGSVDPTSGTVSLVLNLTSGVLGANIQATIDAQIQNRPPVAQFSLAPSIECSAHGGAFVQMDASTSTDADGDIAEYHWYVDTLPAGDGRTASIFVPLGSHTILLRVIDSVGHVGRATQTTVVRDTTPPVVQQFVFSGPGCLWPPNHDYAVLDVARDFSAVVVDACDPNPTFTISSAASSQPDDGSGDGHTADDVVAFSDHVCLRTERAGTILEGRTYTVGLVARDATGNSSDPSVQIVVPHDQGQAGCFPMPVNEGVSDGSPRCNSLPAPAPTNGASGVSNTANPRTLPQGCSQAPGQTTLLLVILAALLFVSRRVRANA